MNNAIFFIIYYTDWAVQKKKIADDTICYAVFVLVDFTSKNNAVSCY